MSGKIEEASTLYEKVLIFEPNNPIALLNLARINYRLGKKKMCWARVCVRSRLDCLVLGQMR